MREERGPDAVSPVRGLDEEILEVETRRRPEGRVVVEEEREADRPSARLRDERLGIPPRPEEMLAQRGGGAYDLGRQPLVGREFADQAEDVVDVVGRRGTDRRFHRVPLDPNERLFV